MSPDRVVHRIVITWSVLLTIFARVQGLKCRTVDHSRRHSEFIDLAEQCNNSTGSNHRLSDRDSFPLSEQGLMNNLGQRIDRGGDGNRRDTTSRMDDRRGSDRRNNNREYSVRRQEYSDRDQYPTSYSCGDNSYGQFPQQRPNYNQDVGQNYYHRGNPYQANSDYDISQSYSRTPTMPPLQMKRYRRHMIRRAASSKLLGNNRFRNATKNGINQTKGSIIDKMDACTIHCVFKQLEMLNANARPDKSSIVSIMTSQIKDVELKEFVQEAIDECFDTLELDSHSNKCEFSKNFATCMENKAQRNCDDWDLPMNSRGTNL